MVIQSMKFLFIAMLCCYSLHVKAAELPTYYIYLAGPEVFLPEPVKAGETAKQLIADLNKQHAWPFILEGVYPLDNEIPDFAPNYETGIRIFDANIELMDNADFIAANMVRFRGPSMDVGTAFEMGYMYGLGKPVFAYYEAEPFYGEPETPGLYKDRVATYYEMSDNPEIDAYGQSIENFGMPDNLMMVGALKSGAGTVAMSLEKAVLQIADYLNSKKPNN